MEFLSLKKKKECKPLRSMKDFFPVAQCCNCPKHLFSNCICPFYTLELAGEETYFAICSKCKESLSKESLSKEWWIRIDEQKKMSSLTGFTLRNGKYNVYEK